MSRILHWSYSDYLEMPLDRLVDYARRLADLQQEEADKAEAEADRIAEKNRK